MTIYDIHPHVVSADTTRYPMTHVFDHVADYVHARPVDAEAMIAAMDRAGITKSITVHSSMAYGYDCRYAADTVDAYPGRFGAVCAVNVRAADAVDKVRYWIAERGLDGIRIFTLGGGMPNDPRWIADPALFPVWETLADLGVPLCFRLPPNGFALLAQTMARFPSVPVILEYLYGPSPGEGPQFASADATWRLAANPNVYVKLKTDNILALSPDPAIRRAFLERSVAEFGSDRIAWGSNYPTAEGSLEQLLADAQRELAFLPQRDREAIFGGTALRLYPALGGARVRRA
jgi:predicted TIM-barrel fold metal-dependent hydrolase